MISLKELVRKAYPDYSEIQKIPDVSIDGLECDSRRVGKNFLFVAIRGKKLDGAGFIQEAVRRGAVAVVIDGDQKIAGDIPRVRVSDCRLAASRLAAVFYGEPAKKLSVIGITGTNGKTTTSYLLEHLLKKENKKTGVIGTVNYRFAGKEIPAAETTPGPLRLQSILSEMLGAGCTHVAMEVSSHALDQGRVADIEFSQGLFTNLTQDHLDYHGTLEKYFECKAKLFLGLSKRSTAVLNADDSRVRGLLSKIKCRALTYGIDHECDIRAFVGARRPAYRQAGVPLHGQLDATPFTLKWGGRSQEVVLPTLGRHNIYNALGALAVMQAAGFSVEKAATHLKDFPGVPGRLERVDRGQDFTVLVDFAHTPDGLENTLNSLREYKKKKLILVFGCGGDRDRTKRPQMAQIASRGSDFVYVTSDNPRSEDPTIIAQEIQAGFPKSFSRYAVVLDRHKAIRRALMDARKGDIVLLAGKGHERTQVIGAEALPFSDRGEAEKVLSGH